METAIWIAGLGTLTLIVTLGGFVWRLSGRLTAAEGTATDAGKRADTAALAVLNNSLKIENVKDELGKHREDVAKEYVSYRHMVNLENRLVEAINSVGTRLDGLFSRFPASH